MIHHFQETQHVCALLCAEFYIYIFNIEMSLETIFKTKLIWCDWISVCKSLKEQFTHKENLAIIYSAPCRWKLPRATRPNQRELCMPPCLPATRKLVSHLVYIYERLSLWTNFRQGCTLTLLAERLQ